MTYSALCCGSKGGGDQGRARSLRLYAVEAGRVGVVGGEGSRGEVKVGGAGGVGIKGGGVYGACGCDL